MDSLAQLNSVVRNQMIFATASSVIALLFIIWIIWSLFRSYKSSVQAKLHRAEIVNRMLEKFGSAKEFTDFLETREGRKFMEDPLPSTATSISRIYRFIQAGIIVMLAGVALFLNAYRLRGETEIHFVNQVRDAQYWGTLSIAIGVGLLLAAVISYFFAKRWNLLNKEKPGNSSD
ncbi:MAG TPA: hypothetical protein VMT04_10020 [Terriglobales bacterium]|nr:hypothetical protein [Terriglobales bacterium]